MTPTGTSVRRLIAGATAVGAVLALGLGPAHALGSTAAGKDHGPKKHTPQVAPARPGMLQACESLTGFAYDSTTITGAETVAAGTLTNAGQPVGEHCRVTGFMNDRVSPVDGQTYRIGFEMRLPTKWAGRYLYQANGGIDGSVVPAVGSFTGGQLRNGLQMGFAVLSSDAGHSGARGPLFGLDPQARLDYGYQAVGTLTPMAKSLIEAAYGRGPDTSYIAGGSNGGRHTMVAAARYADEYDGFLAIAPGFNLPRAAVAQIWGAQQYAKVATTTDDLATAFTGAERQTVADAILVAATGSTGCGTVSCRTSVAARTSSTWAATSAPARPSATAPASPVGRRPWSARSSPVPGPATARRSTAPSRSTRG